MTAETMLDEDLRRIISFARSGRFDDAALAIRQAQARGASGAVFNALAGAVEFHRGQFAAAIPFLQSAHAQRPDDLTVRGNLAESLYRAGRSAEVLPLCDETSARADRSLRLARLGGHLAQEAGDFAHAAALYRITVAADPADWSSWNNLGNALTALDDPAAAIVPLRKAAALVPDSAPVNLNLAKALIDAGEAQEGEALLRRLIAQDPQDPAPPYALFALLRDRRDEDGAYAAIAIAARLAPSDPQIQLDLGQFAAMIARFGEVEAPLRAALAADPTLAQGWVGLASLLERLNREDELDTLRDQAASHGLDAASLAFIDTLRFKRNNDYAQALAALAQTDEEAVAPAQRSYLTGILLDRLGRHDEAFTAFAAMNQSFAADPSDPRARGQAFRTAIRAATALLTREWLASWTPFTPEITRPAPIFLLGFPRSGTTLLDTMLMAEPRVRVLEEEQIIDRIEQDLGGVAALPSLTPAQITEARARYFAEAAKLADLAPNSIILDKHPMHLRHAPTIRRLFPESRFILALRHPCDVLLSCWLTNFRLNNAMASFVDLADAADLYDAAFTQWQKASALFDLPVGTVVYERLVEDTQAELAPLFDWLGLDYAGQDHRAAARARGPVTTASYAQVTEPVYKRAAGRWHRYAAHLAPVAERLAPWIEHFGYAEGAIPPRPTA